MQTLLNFSCSLCLGKFVLLLEQIQLMSLYKYRSTLYIPFLPAHVTSCDIYSYIYLGK